MSGRQNCIRRNDCTATEEPIVDVKLRLIGNMGYFDLLAI